MFIADGCRLAHVLVFTINIKCQEYGLMKVAPLAIQWWVEFQTWKIYVGKNGD